MEERLHKFLAAAGIASRRASEVLIAEGRVKVNGRVVTKPGAKVDSKRDSIEVDGKTVKEKEKPVYLLLYKPVGVVSTVKDPAGRPTVMGLVSGVKKRIYPVGRLDFDTSGLLLMTNDGALTHVLIHPSKEVPKTYRALVKGVPSRTTLFTLSKGVELEDGKTSPAKLSVLETTAGKTLIDITIHEGKNRQVRRMFEAVGHPVISLKRTSFGFLTLGKMRPGEWRYLTAEEIKKLKGIILKSKEKNVRKKGNTVLP